MSVVCASTFEPMHGLEACSLQQVLLLLEQPICCCSSSLCMVMQQRAIVIFSTFACQSSCFPWHSNVFNVGSQQVKVLIFWMIILSF